MTELVKVFVIGALLLLIAGCGEGQVDDSDQRIEQELERRLSGWISRRDKECKSKAVELATARADSMILAYAKAKKIELDRPLRPTRPEAPELRRPSDTLSLAPFLGQDSLHLAQ